MQDDLILQQPKAPAGSAELLLLFHGVGSSAEDLAPLGEVIATQRPQAWVVSVRAPDRSGFGAGWQWFPVQGVTEGNRPERVAAAMPAFSERVAGWLRHTGVDAARTTLIGFSQGAIMALESTQLAERLAGRVIAIAGRFARPPHRAPAGTVVNLMHGDQDRVMPVELADAAERELRALGGIATLDRFAGLGHGIDARVLGALARRLDEPPLWLQIGAEELVLRRGFGDAGETGHSLQLGAARIARDFFRHDPPTAPEIEQAIDFVEDQIMRLGPQRDAGLSLHSRSGALQPWAAVSGATMAIATVEQWFERLAFAAQGRADALEGLPPGREAAATLLVLREFMHHRGHPSVTFVKAA